MSTATTSQPRGSDRPSQGSVTLRHLLAPTDFSETSFRGVNYAVQLAERLDAALSLVHVLETVPPLPGVEGLLLPAGPQMAEEARTRLTALAHQHAATHLRLSTFVLTGKPFNAIALAAEEQATDLIIMATHGYTGFDHLLLGSTAERVVRHAPCSVLIVPARPEFTPAMPLKLTRLLVPIDFSGISELALPWAVTLARAFGAELLLFHAVEPYPLHYLMGPELMNQALTPLLKEVEAALRRMADHVRRSTGIQASALVRDGTPYKAICQAAQDHQADLIALTTHGYSGLKKVWLGSTAERVARHAPCPVLIVREPKTPPSHAPLEEAREKNDEPGRNTAGSQ